MKINDWLEYNNDIFTLDFSQLEIKSKNECIDEILRNQNLDNIYVPMSGGIDSEFVAQTLFDRGINFTPILVDYVSNGAELWFARHWCYTHKITPAVLFVTAEEMKTKFAELAYKHRINFLTAIEFYIEEYVSNLGGRIISSSSEPFQREDNISDTLETKVNPNLKFTLCEYAMETTFGEKHLVNFLTHTPSMLYNLLANIDYDMPIQEALCKYYELTPRPKIAMHTNLFLHGRGLFEEARKVNIEVGVNFVDLGHKDVFLQQAKNKQKIFCKIGPSTEPPSNRLSLL